MEFATKALNPQHLPEGILQVDENICFLMKKSEADLVLNPRKNREAFRKITKSFGGEISFSI